MRSMRGCIIRSFSPHPGEVVHAVPPGAPGPKRRQAVFSASVIPWQIRRTLKIYVFYLTLICPDARRTWTKGARLSLVSLVHPLLHTNFGWQ
jgi:hypothetical protein